MSKLIRLGAVVLSLAASACSESALEPTESRVGQPQAHLSTRTCPLVPLPASANVVTCFTFTLIPGVWHGFLLEASDAQPLPAINGDFTRSRLNHRYILASPGFRKLGDTELTARFEDVHAFQSEFNGVTWFDVVRLQASATGPSQTVPVVVFWAIPASVGGDIVGAIGGLLNSDVVNGGQANALTRKIDHASGLLADGKTAEAIEVLQGFIQQVADLTYVDLVLSPRQGEQLIAWAGYMIAFI